MSLLTETISTVVSCDQLVSDLLTVEVVNADSVAADVAVIDTAQFTGLNATNSTIDNLTVTNSTVTDLTSASLQLNGNVVGFQSPVVAGGDTGDLVYSADGVNFVTVLASGMGALFQATVNGVAGDSQKWIAVARKNMGAGANMAISYNGFGVGSWVAHPSPPNASDIFTVAYNNGLWHCGTAMGFYYSEDGFTWVACTGSYPAVGVNSVTFAQGKWVATGNQAAGTTLCYSLNGIAWLPGTGAKFDPAGYSVVGSSSLFVAVGFDNTAKHMLVSTDGINWTVPPTPPPSTTGYSVAVNSLGTTWVASGEGARFYYSTDGLVWINTGFTSINSAKFVWDGVKFVATGIGSDVPNNNKDTAISYDGIHWNLTDLFLTNHTGTAININAKRGVLAIV